MIMLNNDWLRRVNRVRKGFEDDRTSAIEANFSPKSWSAPPDINGVNG